MITNSSQWTRTIPTSNGQGTEDQDMYDCKKDTEEDCKKQNLPQRRSIFSDAEKRVGLPCQSSSLLDSLHSSSSQVWNSSFSSSSSFLAPLESSTVISTAQNHSPKTNKTSSFLPNYHPLTPQLRAQIQPHDQNQNQNHTHEEDQDQEEDLPEEEEEETMDLFVHDRNKMHSISETEILDTLLSDPDPADTSTESNNHTHVPSFWLQNEVNTHSTRELFHGHGHVHTSTDTLILTNHPSHPHQQQQQQLQLPQSQSSLIVTKTQKSILYTFSDNTYAGRILTWLSTLFLPPIGSIPSSSLSSSSQNARPTTSSASSSSSSNSIQYPFQDHNMTTHPNHTRHGAAFVAFLSLLLVTFANSMLSPMRDAAALAIGVTHIPNLTLASTLLAICSSVPMGWLFEAPNPERRGKRWRDRIGLTRGETQGTSLALFYRIFAFLLLNYAIGFKLVEFFQSSSHASTHVDEYSHASLHAHAQQQDDWNSNCSFHDVTINVSCLRFTFHTILIVIRRLLSTLFSKFWAFFYIAFYLVGNLMKLYSVSLLWGVTSEAMEYEEQAEKREYQRREECHSAQKDKSRTSTSSAEKQERSKEHGKKDAKSSGKQSRARLERLEFVGFGSTLGGILGSVFVSFTAHTLRLSGLLTIAAILLVLSAELSTELGQIMLRHWEEEQRERESNNDLRSLGGSMESMHSSLGNGVHSQSQLVSDVDSSLKRSPSAGSMKRGPSSHSLHHHGSNNSTGNNNSNNNGNDGVDSSLKKVTSMGSMKRIASSNSVALQRSSSSSNKVNEMGMANCSTNKNDSSSSNSNGFLNESNTTSASRNVDGHMAKKNEPQVDDSSFKQRLLRGISTILRSRLLMTIFTYNALYATTNFLLSYQRAELVANRKKLSSTTKSSKVDSHAAFLARINIVSNSAVFLLQGSGLGAWIADTFGQRGTLVLMPLARLFGVAMLALWHVKNDGQPPNLTLFLVLDELTKVINFAVAKPVRESLWHGLSNEARYEAKPIVDTMANRWGGGSAAFLMSLMGKIMDYTGLGGVSEDGSKTLLGFPPVLMLCAISAVWWTMVSLDLGAIRHRIDMELKKQQ